jgi:hypothetical protein
LSTIRTLVFFSHSLLSDSFRRLPHTDDNLDIEICSTLMASHFFSKKSSQNYKGYSAAEWERAQAIKGSGAPWMAGDAINYTRKTSLF